jgi:hypothetical protein
MTEDWRAQMLETIPYLRGQSFVRKSYKAYRPDWEHDHCAVCGVKLMEPGAEHADVVHEGYATTPAYEHGADYEWVCAECFSASQDVMRWTDATVASSQG